MVSRTTAAQRHVAEGMCERIRAWEAAGTGRAIVKNIAGYRFHSSHGNPRRWSVRVTGSYRITFGWTGDHAQDADFEDYH